MNRQLRKQKGCKRPKKSTHQIMTQRRNPSEELPSKRDLPKELDVIQNDIKEVMAGLKDFASNDNQTFSDSDDDEWDTEDEEELKSFDSKYVMKYVQDNGNYKALNWDSLIPFIKDIFQDLQKVKKLDRKAKKVEKRIYELTGNDILESLDENKSTCREIVEVEE